LRINAHLFIKQINQLLQEIISENFNQDKYNIELHYNISTA